MDNVLNRPLFRHREARDRLNESVGVQRFNVGGVVAGAGNPDFGGGSRAPQGVYADPSGAVMPQYRRAPIRPAGLASLSTAQEDTMAEDRGLLFSNALLVAAREKVEMAQRRFENDPSGINQQRYADAVAELEAAQGENATVMEEYNPGPISNIQDRGVLDVEGPEAMVSQMSPEQLDIFNNLGRAAENVVPDTAAPKPVPVGPSGMEIEARRGRPMGPSGMEAEARRARPPAPGEEPAPLGRSTMEADARDRGPLISNPADVAAGLNAEDPAVRERTVADFMKEYTAAAPKYEGADKNLMLAQIGFAIAAGESPNAMQNIANGLLAGSQVLSQDKAAKAEFDRQIQLNAMQYGLEGVERAREKGKPELQFIATKDMKWKGRPVKEGSPVYLSYKDIEDAGGVVPDGLVDAATSAALVEKTQGITKAYQDAYDRGVIDDTELRLATEGYAGHAASVAKSQRALDYFEKTLFKLGEEGNLTGVKGSFQKLIGKIGAAAGFTAKDLDILAESGDAAEMEELLYRGVLNTVPSVVEGQSANSISDTDVRLAMRGLVDLAIQQGTFSSLFTSEEKVMRQIQDSMNLIAGNRQRAFAEMSAIEARLSGRYTKAGDFYNPTYATDVLRPLREASGLTAQPEGLSSYGDMVLGEGGVYKLIFPGG